MADEVVFVIDQAAFHREFRTWEGIVGRDIRKRVARGVVLSKRSAPGPTTRPRNRTGLNYSTGELESRILPGRARWGTELEGRVIAAAPHALFVHEGTKPHPIPTPGKPSKILKFHWAKAGKVVMFKAVSHPGTRRIPFLAENLRSMVR